MGKPKKDEKGITVSKEEDMAAWYSQVIIKGEFADYSPVRGCLVIRPEAYAIWESIQRYLDRLIQDKGVRNAYFPVFIPESFFHREAEHAEGFEAEVAWIEQKDTEERLAVRPTSETIMYDSYAKWIRSWRDLPLRINQWCNIVRWEVKDVKPFLRSREFLWQEGHCVYETEEERNEETQMYLDFYRQVFEDLLAVPVIKGRKTPHETFPGADSSYTIEAFMPDGKALQSGTSHNLSQGFAKAFNINFLGRDEKPRLPYQNSWGLSTRSIGALVMQHGDDKGLVLPPRVAPTQVVIVPILFENTKEAVLKKARELEAALPNVRVKLDDRDEYSPGWKFNEWEMRGIPVRIEIGPKDIEKGHVVLARRDIKEKQFVKFADLPKAVDELLETIQQDLLDRAVQRRKDITIETEDYKTFEKGIEERKLIMAPFCCEKDCEEKLRADLPGATSRCIPLDAKPSKGKCIKCGKAAKFDIYFAKAY